jgi:hypothetical protein
VVALAAWLGPLVAEVRSFLPLIWPTLKIAGTDCCTSSERCDAASGRCYNPVGSI